MTPDQKPEWFQIADADKAASVRKVSKKLPIIALMAVAGILGVGVVTAQTQIESPAVATETVAPVISTSSTPVISTAPTAAATAPKAPTGNENSDDAVSPSQQVAPAPAKSGIAAPKIGKLPKAGEHEGGGEDD